MPVQAALGDTGATESQVTLESSDKGLAQLSGGKVRISDKFIHRSLSPVGNHAELGGKRSYQTNGGYFRVRRVDTGYCSHRCLGEEKTSICLRFSVDVCGHWSFSHVSMGSWLPLLGLQ